MSSIVMLSSNCCKLIGSTHIYCREPESVTIVPRPIPNSGGGMVKGLVARN